MKKLSISIKAINEDGVDPISIPFEPFDESSKWYKEIVEYWGFNEDEIRRKIKANIAFGNRYGYKNIPSKVVISSKNDALVLNIITTSKNGGSFIITMTKNDTTYTCLGIWKYFCIIEKEYNYKSKDIMLDDILERMVMNKLEEN